MRKRLVKNRRRIKNSVRSLSKRPRVQTDGTKSETKTEITQTTDDKTAENAEQNNAIVLRGDEYIIKSETYGADTEEDEKIDIDQMTEETDNYPQEESKHGDIFRLICGFVVVFSLFAAVVLTCFAFAVATKYSDGGEVIDADADIYTESEGENGKVIFIRPLEDGSGILSAPEIYENGVRSAVSVSVRLSSEAGGGEGIGSGFVITDDGYIATAAHVVSGAEKISVILSDKSEYEAELITEDGMSDIALLKIDAKGLSPVEFGSSSEILAGEKVYAIGTPASLEYSGTLSSGEVSCPLRVVSVYKENSTSVEKRMKLIQINAEVNKGNSGCPLFDEYGRVVGMVTMKLGDGYDGIAFALPSDGLCEVLDAMAEGRELNSAILSGVVISPARLGITGESAEVGGVYGYRVNGFTDNGSTAVSSLKSGDLIVEIDKRIITKASDITEATEKKSPGDTARVTVLRSGQRLTFNIVLGS